MSDTQFYSLKVQDVKQETPDTVSVYFEVPSDLSENFKFIQGQYLSLRFTINGKEERRAYSMSSAPLDKHLSVTVKRVEGGKVSNHIADNVKAGDTVDVMPPQGRFYTELDVDQRKNYYLFGAGSGITPLMSIIRAALEQEPQSSVYLLYGSRHDDGIIFHEDLKALADKYKGQFFVDFIVSQPKKEKTSWFKKGKTNWTGSVGRITATEVDRFLDKYPVNDANVECFICGPGAMIDTVESRLDAKAIDNKNIHTERFVTAADKAAKKQNNAAGAGLVKVSLRGRVIDVNVDAKKTILDALIDLKEDAPYSCNAGACSTCMAKVTKGKVTMDECHALDDDEIAEGYILVCQAHPVGDEDVELTFDV